MISDDRLKLFSCFSFFVVVLLLAAMKRWRMRFDVRLLCASVLDSTETILWIVFFLNLFDGLQNKLYGHQNKKIRKDICISSVHFKRLGLGLPVNMRT